jgi:hypothetical protein
MRLHWQKNVIGKYGFKHVVKGPQMGFIVLIASYGRTKVCVSLKLTLPLSRSARSFIVQLRGGHVTNVLMKVGGLIFNGSHDQSFEIILAKVG